MSSKRHASRLKIYLLIFLSVLVIGIVGFMITEDLTLTDALYFTIVTVSTVGYGDLTPHSPLGKVLTLLLIFTGAGTFVSFIALGTDAFLDRREQEARRQKLHMLIGLFYSEVGNDLLKQFVLADQHPDVRNLQELHLQKDWAETDFLAATETLKDHPFIAEAQGINLEGLKDFLQDNHHAMIRLLESPYLLEHNAFADLMIACLHLKEELANRSSLQGLPQSDLNHLSGDIQRIYKELALQWMGYLVHLQQEYPFLYALAVRTNPFNPNASVVVR